MSQNIDFSALENITFNGSTVETMVVDGQTIWAKMESSDIYYVGQTVTIDGNAVVVTEINGTSVTGGGTTVDTSDPGGAVISTTDPNANTTDYTVGQTLYIDGDEKTITSISGSDITFSDGSSVDTSSPGGVQISTTDPNANTTGNNVTNTASAGDLHSLYLKSDGSLWAMGRNNYGQLGIGNNLTRKSPVQVLDAEYGSPVTDVVSVFAGSRHSLFTKSDGSLWGIGGNTYGQLGDGTDDNRKSPVLVSI